MRLLEWCHVTDSIPECQSGFRPDRRTIDNVFTTHAAIQIQMRIRKHPVYCIFVDFKKAFDSVKHIILLSQLGRLGLCNPLLLWIQHCLSGRTQIVAIFTFRK